MNQIVNFIRESFVYGLWLRRTLGNSCFGCYYSNNRIVLLTDNDSLHSVILFLRDHTNCQYKVFSDLVVVDFPSRKYQFVLFYFLLSIRYNRSIAVVIEGNYFWSFNSLVSVFKGINWFEREAYDMFGLVFKGHPNLRRILTDYGFYGYPLRKNFPVMGYIELRYDFGKKVLVNGVVNKTQSYRKFNFSGFVYLFFSVVFIKFLFYYAKEAKKLFFYFYF